MRIIAFILALAVWSSLHPENSIAQQQKIDPSPQAMTVAQAVAIGTALRQLGDYQEGGKTIAVPFRFNGNVLMAMASNIALSDQVRKNYQEAYNGLIRQISGGKDRVPEEKMGEFNAQIEKAAGAPSSVRFERIKESDLCLASPPKPPCQVTNAIPPAILAAILPIVDR